MSVWNHQGGWYLRLSMSVYECIYYAQMVPMCMWNYQSDQLLWAYEQIIAHWYDHMMLMHAWNCKLRLLLKMCNVTSDVDAAFNSSMPRANDECMHLIASLHHDECNAFGTQWTKKEGGPFEPPFSLHFPLRGQCQSLPPSHHPLWVEWIPHIHSSANFVPSPAFEWSWMPKHALARRHLY